MRQQHVTHEQLTDRIRTLETTQREAERELRFLRTTIKSQETALAQARIEAKTLETLSLSIFGSLGSSAIYQVLCETLTTQLGWQRAVIVTIQGSRTLCPAAAGFSQAQLTHIRDYAAQERRFTESYHQRESFTTYHSHDRTALALRALFHADELLAVPIFAADTTYGYLVVTADAADRLRSERDLSFLAVLATHVAQAVAQSATFSSLQSENTRLRQLDELKNAFISITSHQLRTPLSVVKWILAILQDNKSIASLAEPRKLIEQAYASNERLIHVVNDLLNVSRIQEGRLPYNPQPTDLRELILDACTAAERLCSQREITVEHRLASKLPVMTVDPILFKEALQNLLDNAVDYSFAKGWVRVEAECSDTTLSIAVTNHGPGIPPKELARIFTQFYRSPEAIEMQPSGNGLGLYLARTIIREHGGDLTCTSTVGKETTFTICIPRTDSQPTSEKA